MNECQLHGEPTFFTRLKQAFIENSSQLLSLGQYLIIALLAGFLFNKLHVPVGWLLGPMAAGIVCAAIEGRSQTLSPMLVLVSRAVLGLVAASRFSPDTLEMAVTYALPLMFCIPIAAGLSLLNGYLLWRWSGIERATSFLGCIPGASFGIIAMSEEMGADALAVALLQYIRVLLVVAIVPAIATYLFPHLSIPPEAAVSLPLPHAPSLSPWLNLSILALCCPLGMGVGNWLRLPSSAFLGAFFVGLAAFWSLPEALYIPQWLFIAGLLVVGLSIGLRFDWLTARKLLKAALIDVGLVLILILSCAGIAYGFHHFARVDTMTAILGFTPGGIEAMVATTIQLGGDTGLVLAMQMTRMFFILFLSPWLIGLWLKPELSGEDSTEQPTRI